MRSDNLRFCLAVSGIMVLGFPASAFAYLDPGSGSVLLQGILAALAAIAVTVKLYWHRLLRILGLKQKDKAEDDVVADSNDSYRSTPSETIEDHRQ